MSELEEKKVQAQQPASAAKPAATRPAAPSAVAAPAAPAENEIHPRTVTIDEFHREMERLKDEEKMDMLELITGEDWQEEGLGCVYNLWSTDTGKREYIKMLTK